MLGLFIYSVSVVFFGIIGVSGKIVIVMGLLILMVGISWLRGVFMVFVVDE